MRPGRIVPLATAVLRTEPPSPPRRCTRTGTRGAARGERGGAAGRRGGGPLARSCVRDRTALWLVGTAINLHPNRVFAFLWPLSRERPPRGRVRARGWWRQPSVSRGEGGRGRRWLRLPSVAARRAGPRLRLVAGDEGAGPGPFVSVVGREARADGRRLDGAGRRRRLPLADGGGAASDWRGGRRWAGPRAGERWRRRRLRPGRRRGPGRPSGRSRRGAAEGCRRRHGTARRRRRRR